MELRGVLPPVVTPLDADERVDEVGLERQIERMIEGGMHGIYLLGSTGEGPALRDTERRRAIEAARRIVRGRVPLVVGCMASSTARAVDTVRAAESAGAEAVAVTPPHYYPVSTHAAMVEHYRRCTEATSLPIVIYNIPLTTKVMLSPETVMAISALPGVVGIKDSSGDMTQMVRLLTARGDNPAFHVLVGAPAISGAALLLGADGIIPGIGNLDPKLTVELFEAGSSGDIARVRALQPRLLSLLRVFDIGPGVSVLKTALELMGVCAAHATAPFPRLDETQRVALTRLLREHGLLP